MTQDSNQRSVLAIHLSSKDVALIKMVARLRLGILDGREPDLGAYLRGLINQDITLCLHEIQSRGAV